MFFFSERFFSLFKKAIESIVQVKKMTKNWKYVCGHPKQNNNNFRPTFLFFSNFIATWGEPSKTRISLDHHEKKIKQNCIKTIYGKNVISPYYTVHIFYNDIIWPVCKA